MTALVGLDVGTTGVKALALSPEGEVLARRVARLPALDAAAGLGRAGPRGRWDAAAESALGEVADGPRRRRHRALGPDARPRRARRRRPCDPPRDPLERPAHGRRVRRDRGARRARAADRAHGEPRADGVHRAEAALAAPARARRLRAHRAHPAAEGLRPPAPDGRVGDRRLGRLGDAAARRRSAAPGATEVLDALELPVRLAAARARVARPRRRRPGRPAAGARPVAAGAGDQPAAAIGVGVDRPGRALGRARDVRRRPRAAAPAYAARPGRRACMRSATPCRAPGRRWA